MAKRRRRRRGGWLAKIPVLELQAELSRRRGQITQLQRHHDGLAAELDRVREELDALGAAGDAAPPSRGRARRGRGPGRRRSGRRAGAGRRRPHNTMTLVDALGSVLKGKTMSVTDVAGAVQQAGYKTSAENFRTIVNQTLINSGKFKRRGRGKYTAK